MSAGRGLAAATAALLFAAALVWSIGAFVQWDANPGGWSDDARKLGAFLFECFGLPGAAIAGAAGAKGFDL